MAHDYSNAHSFKARRSGAGLVVTVVETLRPFVEHKFSAVAVVYDGKALYAILPSNDRVPLPGPKGGQS